MLTKFRTIAILLLAFTTLAAARQDTDQPKSGPQNASAQEERGEEESRKDEQAVSAPHLFPLAPAAKKKVAPAKVRRMARAFVASVDLKVMARQLVENRTPAAYAGVEDYARRHAAGDAGALAWLAVGYSRVLDQQYPQAIAALEKAKPHAGELYDYVRYLEAISYGAEGNSAKVVELLRNFDVETPESIFQKEVVDIYGSSLAAQNKTQEAIAYLEAHRQPMKASVELALGKCYLHTRSSRERDGDPEASVLHHAGQRGGGRGGYPV